MALAAGNSLPTGDTQSFTTIGALYDATDTIIRNKNRSQWSNFKRVRPSDEEIADLGSIATEYWSRFAAGFPELRALVDDERSEVAGQRLRDQTYGGHILFRPIGLIIYARTAKSLIETGLSLQDVISRLSRVPTALAEPPWAALVWDPKNRRMLTAKPNRDAAERLLFHSVGGDLQKYRVSPSRLTVTLAGLLNQDEASIVLPRYA